MPATKLDELRLLVAQWQGKKFCVKKDLQSLVGKLQHASKVVRSGRTFLQRMFELLKGTSKKQHFIRLNTSFRPHVVESVSIILERDIHVRRPSMEVSSLPPIHGCLRLLRLRSMVRAVLVPVLLAKWSQTAVHIKTPTSCNCCGDYFSLPRFSKSQ